MNLLPPESVRGMQQLDREKFTKQITVPSLLVANENVGKSMKVLKKYLLKVEKLKPVVEDTEEKKRVLLNPNLFGGFKIFDEDQLQTLKDLDVAENHLSDYELEMKYENYKVDDILKAVLPEGKEGCTSYSRIGHIIHLNLRDHLLSYKWLIGQVFVDKLHGVRTVVNKNHIIDSTYRNFQMEVLAGEADFIATVKENTCTFTFDFSQVYWNPRLCTEHERIVKLLPENCVLFDVFAGVGPFAVPAAKVRKCRVFANDLNPHSTQWLKENVHRNKAAHVEVFNKDGRQFIRENLRDFILQEPESTIHVTLNLPALAVEFLDSFCGLLDEDSTTSDGDLKQRIEQNLNMTVHVYSFCQESSATEEMRMKVESVLKCDLQPFIIDIIDVRDVSPKKHMIRMSFKMPWNVLLTDDGSPTCKRSKWLE
nr:EOG090X08TI [Cyclestheria hislopi]